MSKNSLMSKDWRDCEQFGKKNSSSNSSKLWNERTAPVQFQGVRQGAFLQALLETSISR